MLTPRRQGLNRSALRSRTSRRVAANNVQRKKTGPAYLAICRASLLFDQNLIPLKETRAIFYLVAAWCSAGGFSTSTRGLAAWVWAVNTHWDLLANYARDATSNRVRHLARNAAGDLNGLLFANRTTHGVAHGLGALLGHHATNLVAAGLGLGDHVADLIAAGLGALLGYHAANLVAASLGLGDHVADFVAAGFSLRNHVTNLVAASAGLLARYRAADFVAAGLGLRNHVADFVAAGACAWFAHVLGAADFLGVAFRYPHTLAAGFRRGLAAERLAGAGAIYAPTAARVVGKRAWLANGLGKGLAGNLIGFGFPVTTADLNGLGVRNGYADVVGFFPLARFPHGLAHGVVSLTCFPDRFVGGVGYFAGASFPHGLAHGVAALFGFPDRLSHGVAALLGFPHWMIRGVADVAGLCFPNRLAHGVATGLGFPNGLANGVTNFLLTLFVNIAGAIDHPIFAHSIVNCLAASHLLLVPFNTPHRFHHGMAMLLVATWGATIVTCDSAIPRPRCRRQHC